jgi:hypothetical protein
MPNIFSIKDKTSVTVTILTWCCMRTQARVTFSSDIGVLLLLESINLLYKSVLMAFEMRDGTLCRGLNVLTCLGG